MGDMKAVTCKLYANNELRVMKTDLPYRQFDPSDKKAQRQSELAAQLCDNAYSERRREGWLHYMQDDSGSVVEISEANGYGRTRLSDRTLTLSANFKPSNSEKSSKERKGYGQLPKVTRFSRYARHTLLEAGSVFDRELAASHQGLFLTFTLPGSRDDAYICLAKWSGFVVNRVISALRKHKLAKYYFYAWELQKRGALHLHLFIALPREVSISSPRDTARNAWYSALEAIRENTGVDLYLHKKGNYSTAKRHWQFDCQPVKKSAAAYISKYVSKGATEKSEVTIDGERVPICPHRWWGCSRGFKRLVDDWRITVSLDGLMSGEQEKIADMLCRYAMELGSVMHYSYNADIKSTNADMGKYGTVQCTIFYFPPDQWKLLHFLLRAKLRMVALRNKCARLRYSGHPWVYEGEHIDSTFAF